MYQNISRKALYQIHCFQHQLDELLLLPNPKISNRPKKSRKLTLNKKAACITDFEILEQLKQVETKRIREGSQTNRKIRTENEKRREEERKREAEERKGRKEEARRQGNEKWISKS